MVTERKRFARARRALGPLVLSLLAVPVSAQQQVTVSADIPVASPTGSGVRNLTFGVVTPQSDQPVTATVPAAVAPAGAGMQSGEFRFDLSGAGGISFTVSPPTELTAPGAADGLALSSDGTQYGGWCILPGAGPCTLSAFNPVSATVRICHDYLGNGNCRPNRAFPAGTIVAVYIGGLLTVPSTQKAGVYTGTMTLTIVQVH
jgi:spore coat protein U-like protein